MLQIFDALITLFWIALFVRMLLSWFPIPRDNPISRFVFQITEPVLGPIRRLLPRTGFIDLSPLVLFFLLIFLQRIIHAAA